MGRRTLLLIVSILVAAVGVALVGLYVRGADQRANDRAEARYGPQANIIASPTPTPAARHTDLAGVGLTIELKPENQALGLLQPGDMIALYVTRPGGKTESVVDRIRVISVGTKGVSPGGGGDTIAPTIIGLDASLDDAVEIETAKSKGTLAVFVLGAHQAAITSPPTPPPTRRPAPAPSTDE